MKNKVPTGAIECGIIQLSADFVRPKLHRGGKTAIKDSLSLSLSLSIYLSCLERRKDIFDKQNNPQDTAFDEYVQPLEDAELKEEDRVHSLSATHPSIGSARKMKEVLEVFLLVCQ